MLDVSLTVTLLCICPQIDCYDHHISGSHDLIGSCQTTLAEMQQGTHFTPVRRRLFRTLSAVALAPI